MQRLYRDVTINSAIRIIPGSQMAELEWGCPNQTVRNPQNMKAMAAIKAPNEFAPNLRINIYIKKPATHRLKIARMSMTVVGARIIPNRLGGYNGADIVVPKTDDPSIM